jgi:heme-degrading monooxygenase HmoA
MAPIASFHLVRERRGRGPLVMARMATDRPRLSRTPGLRFWRLLGTGRGANTGPSADLRRSALFAVWDDEAALDDFLATSTIARRWRAADEHWQVRLRGVAGHGRWRGVDVLAGLTPGDPDGPLAVVTRADVRLGAWRAFGRAGTGVDVELQDADGLLAVVGIGEAPVGRLGTFSLWRSAADVRAFTTSPHHAEVIRRTRRERWYGEELFARFEPYASSGSWGGDDPLRP